MYPMSYRRATVSHNHTHALQVARNVLEALRARPFGMAFMPSLPSALADETYAEMVEGAADDDKEAKGPTYVTFKKTVSYSTGACIAAGRPDGYDVVTVTVKWREGTAGSSEGRDKSLTLSGGISREP
jgi:hypothetical protein